MILRNDPIRALGRRVRVPPTWVIAASILVLSPMAEAQLPSLPVLQNAFANAGVTVGLNYGHSSDETGYAAAIAWAPSSTRFQVSLGFGFSDPEESDRGSAWGTRATVPIVRSLWNGRLGVAAFGGVGGAKFRQSGDPQPPDVSVLRVPAGAAVGMRMRMGASRGISIYAAPFYSWTRVSIGNTSVSGGVVRVSAGIDITLLAQLGVTVGYEGGAKAKADDPGPTGGLFGVGLSYALRRPQ